MSKCLYDEAKHDGALKQIIVNYLRILTASDVFALVDLGKQRAAIVDGEVGKVYVGQHGRRRRHAPGRRRRRARALACTTQLLSAKRKTVRQGALACPTHASWLVCVRDGASVV